MRPFRVLGIQQIALGAESKSSLLTLWVELLGLQVTGHFVSERENVDEDICTLGRGAHAVEVELMQPLVREHMEKVHALAVPLQVDMGVGPNWRDLE